MKVFSIWRCTGSAGVYLSVESGKDTNERLYGMSKMAVSKRLRKLHEKLRSSVT